MKQSPIRKMAKSVFGPDNWRFMDEAEHRLADKILAKHVKPLLDALAYQPHAVGHGDGCLGCNADIRRERLLAAWKP